MREEACKKAHSLARLLQRAFAAAQEEEKKPSRREREQRSIAHSFSLPPYSPKPTQDMDAHKLTGRLALAAVAVAAMQVSEVKREEREEEATRAR